MQNFPTYKRDKSKIDRKKGERDRESIIKTVDERSGRKNFVKNSDNYRFVRGGRKKHEML